MGLVTAASRKDQLVRRKPQVEADFPSAIGCNPGAIGSYERGSLGSSLLILVGCWEDADSCTIVNQEACARMPVCEAEEGDSRIPLVDRVDGHV